jgi:hypothetical protein
MNVMAALPWLRSTDCRPVQSGANKIAFDQSFLSKRLHLMMEKD